MACTTMWADENINYSVKWPGGATHGRGQFKTDTAAANMAFSVDASIGGTFATPDVPAKGSFQSARNNGCTTLLSKRYEVGFRKSSETTTVNGTTGTRQSTPGGSSTFTTAACPVDVLAYIEVFRKALSAGQKPTSATVLFGATYQLAITYPTPTNGNVDTAHFVVTGPKSTTTVEIDFQKDATRTPVTIRVPMTVGTVALEIVR